MDQSLFAVLAEPTRLRIVDALRGGERAVGELAEATGQPQPTVSKHLKVLRDAGFVASRRDAQWRIYALRPAPFARIAAWLDAYRSLWSSRLDDLEHYLDRTEDERAGNGRGDPTD